MRLCRQQPDGAGGGDPPRRGPLPDQHGGGGRRFPAGGADARAGERAGDAGHGNDPGGMRPGELPEGDRLRPGPAQPSALRHRHPPDRWRARARILQRRAVAHVPRDRGPAAALPALDDRQARRQQRGDVFLRG